MTISAVGLRNFRGFRSTSIALKPLTVLLGPNSAGKSAFGHALAAMSHAQWVHSGSAQATLSPRDAKVADEWPIDLGQYADLRTHGSNDKVYIELLTSEGAIEFGFGGVDYTTDLRLSYIRLPPDHDPASNTAPELSHDSSIQITVPPGSITTAPISRIGAEVGVSGFEFFRRNPNEWTDVKGRVVRLGLDGLFVDTLRHETGTQIAIPTVAQNEVRQFLTDLTYLRASRKRPCRGYESVASSRSPLGYAGEWTALVLSKAAKAEVEYLEAPMLPTSASEAVKLLEAPWRSRRTHLAAAVGYWLGQLGLAAAVDTRESQLYPGRIEIRVTYKPGQASRDITEIGYGISQVLPVLVGGLLEPQQGPYIVDLPEGHLHPCPQAALADFFCSLALSGKCSIVETHSEMFFHRLRLRAAANRALMDNIAVYFFDAPSLEEGCASPRLVGLDFKDELKWPTGFLQEGWEMEAQISAFREARKGIRR